MRYQGSLGLSVFTKHKSALFIIGIIVFFYLINNFIWLRENTYPYGPDEFRHLWTGWKFSESIFAEGGEFLYLFARTTGHWPPLFYISSAIVAFFLGTSYVALVMTNLPYLIILLISVYFIGLKLFDRITGLLAAVLISAYPMIFIYSRHFNLDFALTAMTCLSICSLIYTDYFKEKKYCLLFGLSLGLGMLTRTTYILFLIGPLGYTFSRIFLLKRNKAIRLKKISRNLILSLCLGILVASLWYWPAFPAVAERTETFLWTITHRSFTITSELNSTPLFHLHKFFNYLHSLISEQASLLFFVAFLITLPFFLRLKNNFKLLLISWFTIPYLILSLSFQQEGRFMMPALPAIALISAAGIQNITAKKRRITFCVLIFVLGMAQFFHISYYPRRSEQNLLFQSENRRGLPQGPPLKKDWKADEIADSIVKYCKTWSGFPIFMGIICDDRQSNDIYGYSAVIDYYLIKKGVKRCESINLLEDQLAEIVKLIINIEKFNSFIFISKDSSWSKPNAIFDRFIDRLARRINSSQGIAEINNHIIPFGESAYGSDTFIKIAKQRLENFLSNIKPFERISLPDGYFAHIYAKKIVSIEKGLLKLVTDNNRYRIFYRNTEITKDLGLRTVFKYQGNRYNSSQLSWQVEKINPVQLLAKCVGPDLPFTQIWKIEILEDSRIDWQVEFETSKQIKLSDIQATLLLSSDYQHWINASKEGNFPRMHLWAGQWQDILPSSSISPCLGVKGLTNGRTVLPGVLFEPGQNSLVNRPLLQNTDYRTDARVLGFRSPEQAIALNIGRQKLLHAEIGIFTQDQDMLARLEEIKKAYLITDGPLELYFRDGAAKIYHRGLELTEDKGIRLDFRLVPKGRYYDSREAVWDVEMESEIKLVARGTWLELGLSQIWTLQITEQGRIDWQVEFETSKQIKLSDIQATLLLSSDYQHWINASKEGNFPRMHLWAGQWQDILPSSSISPCLGVKGLTNGRTVLPGVLFEPGQNSLVNRPLLQNTDYRTDARVLGFRSPEQAIALNIGRQKLLHAEIGIFTQDQDMLARLEEIKKAYLITQGHLELYFSTWGIFELYYRNTRISKQPGLSTCFVFRGNSYDTSSAIWQIDKLSPSRLIAKGRWQDLPFILIWQLEILENDIVDWQILMEAKERIQIDRGPYANLILFNNYQKWVTLHNQGIFSPIVPWQKKWSWVGQRSSSVCIGVRESRKGENILPGVLLRIEERLILDRTVPQNTSYTLRARALDVQREKDTIEPLILSAAGSHSIFSGQIIVFEKDEDIDIFLRRIREQGE